MIPLNLSELAVATAGRLCGADVTVTRLDSDSRKMAPGSLFVALRGERFDGHDFAEKAIEGGASALLVERELPFPIPQLVVENTQKAMGRIGALVRDRVNPISVALTGSNGKTSVKEMVAAVLTQRHQVLYTAGNFNNEIGVPLTLLRLEAQHEYGVFELGANHKGEIDYTSSLVRPLVSLVNNVGSAHLEGFGSEAGVAEAKSEIYLHLAAEGTGVVNADDKYADVMLAKLKGKKVLKFGLGNNADVTAREVSSDAFGRHRFLLCHNGSHVQVELPLAGRHQVHNALATASICIALGISLDEVASGLKTLVPVKGRMVPISLGRITVVDDTYNANPNSVGVAIDWLKEINANRILVLGDLGELGDNAALLHAGLGERAKQAGLDGLFCLGQLSRHTSQAFGSEHFEQLDALVQTLISHINGINGDVVLLVKGSRSAAMERVVEALTAAHGRGELK